MVAQTPVQLARAAAQREAREAGRTREGAGGDRHGMRGGPLSAMHHPRMPVHEWGCTQASCCVCPLATAVRGDFRRDRFSPIGRWLSYWS